MDWNLYIQGFRCRVMKVGKRQGVSIRSLQAIVPFLVSPASQSSTRRQNHGPRYSSTTIALVKKILVIDLKFVMFSTIL